MEQFESEINKIFDFNRFELQPELAELISGFEKSDYGREDGMREPISFKELQGTERADIRSAKSAEKAPSVKKDKGTQL